MALSFNGSNQYVIKNSDLGITGGVITLSIWVKLNAEISSGEWCFVSQIDAGTHVKYAIDYKYNSGTRQLSFYRTRYAVVDNQATYNITLGTSNWYHLVLTYDGSNVKGYVNGVLQAGPTASSGNGTSGGSDCFAVASEGGTTFYANATLFDARCYNRVITDNEISEIYHRRGADKVWSGLVGWWRLDDYPTGISYGIGSISESLDSTTGWVVSRGATGANSSIKYEGTASLYLTKTDTTVLLPTLAKFLASAVDVSNKTLVGYVYIKDATVKGKLDYIRMDLRADGGTHGFKYEWAVDDMPTGEWIELSCNVDNYTDNWGTPDITDIDRVAYLYATNNVTDTIATDEVLFDYFHVSPLQTIDISGNGNHGTLNGGTFQSSPHRLRRGVLVS